MLVVDRVVLNGVEQTEQVGKLEGGGYIVAEEDLNSGDEVVQIRHLCDDVVSRDQARALALRDELRGQVPPEMLNQRRHAALLRGLRDGGGIAPRHGISGVRNSAADSRHSRRVLLRDRHRQVRGGRLIISTYCFACSTHAVEQAEKYAYSGRCGRAGGTLRAEPGSTARTRTRGEGRTAPICRTCSALRKLSHRGDSENRLR